MSQNFRDKDLTIPWGLIGCIVGVAALVVGSQWVLWSLILAVLV